MKLLPVQITEVDDGAARANDGSASGALAWTLDTSRGELRVYAGTEDSKGLRVAIAFLLGGEA